MARRQDGPTGSINRRDAVVVVAEYAAWLGDQPLSARTREAYLAAVSAFAGWLERREGGPGDALVAPRARDLAARDYKRHMKVERGLSPASVNQALAGLDHLFRFLGLGAAIVGREELPRAAPRALDVRAQRALLQAAEESTARDRAIVALLPFTGLRLSEAAALRRADVRISARKGLVVVRSGKGDAYREVELNALVRGMLEEWIAGSSAVRSGVLAVADSVRQLAFKLTRSSLSEQEKRLAGLALSVGNDPCRRIDRGLVPGHEERQPRHDGRTGHRRLVLCVGAALYVLLPHTLVGLVCISVYLRGVVPPAVTAARGRFGHGRGRRHAATSDVLCHP